jgi:hypothetical protein
MLQDRNTSRFLHESIQQYGGVEQSLDELAIRILDSIPPRSRDGATAGSVGPHEFATRARHEIAFLKRQHEAVNATVEVRSDVTGLMVSSGDLLVSDQSRIPSSRVETFRALDRMYDFAQRTAFVVTMRTFRSGGLTKDAVYLRGIRQILEYLGKGGELPPLFIGKIATQHIPIVQELRWRGVLREPPLLPSYMTRPDAVKRLERLQTPTSVTQLIERRDG